jgi:hypothetical protein
MMADSLGGLREINKNLRMAMFRLRPEHKHVSALSPRDFLDLRKQVSQAGRCLQLLPTMAEAAGDVREELVEYRRNLEKLRRFLPDVQVRLVSERSRLIAARTHAAAASHWAQAGRPIP